MNLPNEATVEDVYNIYLEAWENGLKGITIYRSGCKREGILTTDKPEKKEESIQLDVIHDELPRGFVVTTGCGTLHCEAFFHPETGELLETYLSKGSKGGCNNFMIGLSRMISLAARGGLGIDAIIDQLNSCGVCPSYAVRTTTKKDTSNVDTQYRLEESLKSMEQYDVCPECHQKGLTHIGGCNECILCGWTRCS